MGVARRSGAIQYTSEVLSRLWDAERVKRAAAAAAAEAEAAVAAAAAALAAPAQVDASTGDMGGSKAATTVVAVDDAIQADLGKNVGVQATLTESASVISMGARTDASSSHHGSYGSASSGSASASEPASACSTCSGSVTPVVDAAVGVVVSDTVVPRQAPTEDEAVSAVAPMLCDPRAIEAADSASRVAAPSADLHAPAAAPIKAEPGSAEPEIAPAPAAPDGTSTGTGAKPRQLPAVIDGPTTKYQLNSPPPTARRRQVAVPISTDTVPMRKQSHAHGAAAAGAERATRPRAGSTEVKSKRQSLPRAQPFSSTGASLGFLAFNLTCGVLSLSAAASLLSAAAWYDDNQAMLSGGSGSGSKELSNRMDREVRFAYVSFLVFTLASIVLTGAIAAWAGVVWTRSRGIKAARSWEGAVALVTVILSVLSVSIPPRLGIGLAATRLAFSALAFGLSVPFTLLLVRRWHRDAHYTQLQRKVERTVGAGPGTGLPARRPNVVELAASLLQRLRHMLPHAFLGSTRPIEPTTVRVWKAVSRPPSFGSQLLTFIRRAWLQEMSRMPTTLTVLCLLAAVGGIVGLVFRSVNFMSWTVRLLLVEIIIFLVAATTCASHIAAERALNKHERAVGVSVSASFLARQLVSIPSMVLQPYFFLLIYLASGRIYAAPAQQLGLLICLGFAGGGLGTLTAAVFTKVPYLVVCVLAIFIAVFNSFSPTFETLRALGLTDAIAHATLAWSPIRWASEGMLLSEIEGLPVGWVPRKQFLLKQYEFQPANLSTGQVYVWPLLFGLLMRAAALVALEIGG